MKGGEAEKERDGEKLKKRRRKGEKGAIRVQETSKIRRGDLKNEEKQQTMKKEEKVIWREKNKNKYRFCQKHDL